MGTFRRTCRLSQRRGPLPKLLWADLLIFVWHFLPFMCSCAVKNLHSDETGGWPGYTAVGVSATVDSTDRVMLTRTVTWQTDAYNNYHQCYHTTPLYTPLTLLPLIPLRLYTLPYWCNPPVLIFDIRALWRSVLSATVPESQKSKLVGYTSMALNASNCNNLEQLALKGLIASRFTPTGFTSTQTIKINTLKYCDILLHQFGSVRKSKKRKINN